MEQPIADKKRKVQGAAGPDKEVPVRAHQCSVETFQVEKMEYLIVIGLFLLGAVVSSKRK